ncbi:MAG: cytochrome c maturation protein CcmE [Hyphomicrobiales bacterium]|jgi:cytochrome c-type biogenesis protein CcmE
MTRKQKRLSLIVAAGLILASSAALILYALNDRIVFFYTPSDLTKQVIGPGTRVRIGGLVDVGSVDKSALPLIKFAITDGDAKLPVVYKGSLPDLFREGQGVVSEGVITPDHVLQADTVLAKHDENYMPKEVADALKEKGVWQGGIPK